MSGSFMGALFGGGMVVTNRRPNPRDDGSGQGAVVFPTDGQGGIGGMGATGQGGAVSPTDGQGGIGGMEATGQGGIVQGAVRPPPDEFQDPDPARPAAGTPVTVGTHGGGFTTTPGYTVAPPGTQPGPVETAGPGVRPPPGEFQDPDPAKPAAGTPVTVGTHGGGFTTTPGYTTAPAGTQPGPVETAVPGGPLPPPGDLV